MADSKLWEDAYKQYKVKHPVVGDKLTPLKRITISGQKKVKVKQQDTWLKTQKEYLRFRKTEGFAKWRYKQFLRQGGTCYYCDTPLPGVRQNVDHVVPKSRGGSNNTKNLVLACAKCNKDKFTNLLSKKEKDKLKEKNRKKKGTYTEMMNEYSEEYLARRLYDMFRED